MYYVKASAFYATAESGIFAIHFSSSTVKVAATTDSSNYKVGRAVVLSGLVFDDDTPTNGAVVSAAISARVSLSGRAVIRNFKLVKEHMVDPAHVEYSYSVTMTNNGPAAESVRAQLESSSPNVSVLV